MAAGVSSLGEEGAASVSVRCFGLFDSSVAVIVLLGRIGSIMFSSSDHAYMNWSLGVFGRNSDVYF